MNTRRAREILARYPTLRVAVLGDFCLDRYLEIDPALAEISIETGRTVHNVVRRRAQPGGAGTIVNNLVALRPASVHALGFCGEDGEGTELARALGARSGVNLQHFLQTDLRHTFTYCKPILLHPDAPPEELDRIDTKNWTPTPAEISQQLADSLEILAPELDALVVLDQVDHPGTGTVTDPVRDAIARIARARPALVIVADSRTGLREFPPALFKMNAAELAALTGHPRSPDPERARDAALELARANGRPVVVTLAERGMVGASPDGLTHHVPAFPLRGPTDIVGAGDSVSANLACALAVGATLDEALVLASAAASIVIHQLGTTGTASTEQILALVEGTDPAL